MYSSEPCCLAVEKAHVSNIRQHLTDFYQSEAIKEKNIDTQKSNKDTYKQTGIQSTSSKTNRNKYKGNKKTMTKQKYLNVIIPYTDFVDDYRKFMMV